MADQRSRDGVVTDRREIPDAPRWSLWIVALFAAACLVALVALFNARSSASDAEHAAADAGHAAHAAQAALNAARAATDRLHTAAFGVCQRQQRERERTNLTNATIWLVLRRGRDLPGRPPFGTFADAATYGPPADCSKAVDRPASYRQPAPVPYRKLPLSFAMKVITAGAEEPPGLQPQPTAAELRRANRQR
jgi:hypothetical protein